MPSDEVVLDALLLEKSGDGADQQLAVSVSVGENVRHHTLPPAQAFAALAAHLYRPVEVVRYPAAVLRNRRQQLLGHGVASLGIKVAASSVWNILKEHGADPAPERDHTTWATFLRSQAQAILAADFFETKAPERSDAVRPRGDRARHPPRADPRRDRAPHRRLGHSARPEHGHGPPRRRLQGEVLDPGPDVRYPASFDTVLQAEGVEVIQTGAQMPRMNAIMERWVRTCRRELLDRTLIWNQRHLLHALREFEIFYNGHRPHQGIANARPLAPLPAPITDPDQVRPPDHPPT